MRWQGDNAHQRTLQSNFCHRQQYAPAPTDSENVLFCDTCAYSHILVDAQSNYEYRVRAQTTYPKKGIPGGGNTE